MLKFLGPTAFNMHAALVNVTVKSCTIILQSGSVFKYQYSQTTAKVIGKQELQSVPYYIIIYLHTGSCIQCRYIMDIFQLKHAFLHRCLDAEQLCSLAVLQNQ